MLAKSHVISSMIIAVPLSSLVAQEYVMMFLVTVVIGSLFPDLDEKGSYLSRRVYIVSYVISMFTTHRGHTHSILALVLYFIIGFLISKYFEVPLHILGGFLLGNLIHFTGDMTTKSGLTILYPFSKSSFHLLPKNFRLRTNSKLEKYFVVPVLGSALVCNIYIFIPELLDFKLV